MKIPDFVGLLFHKKTEDTEVFISLYLDVHSVAVSFWSIGSQGTCKTLGSEDVSVKEDSWDARSDAVDRLLGILEEKTGQTDISKVILGIPSTYLTPAGEVRKEILPEIKKLTHALELKPIGFVPVHQAVIYKMKKDEGVPPSVILLGINHQAIAITLYKIGSMAGVREIEKHDDVALSVEQGLKSFTDLEVLPARMLLYGSDPSELEEIKSQLLRHQWTTNVNFLHFPKIEIISLPMIIEAVSLAGASELSSTIAESEEVLAPPLVTAEETEAETPPNIESETHVAIADSTPLEVESPETVSEEVAHAQEVIAEDFAVDEVTSDGDANVVMVDAESLGFKKDVDVLEEDHPVKDGRKLFVLPRIDFSRLKIPRIGILLSIVGFLIFLFILYWIIPHVTVTVLEIPKTIESFETITIDPTATIVDAEHKIVPGKKREKSISGDKTVPVIGKKNIGDSAKGIVTIYNKSVSEKTFKKGTILISKSLQFSLDQDVIVAAASVSGILGGETKKFGIQNVPVTAVAIGLQSNIPAGGDFTFKDVSSETAVGVNENAFFGGNSKEVTVVSRSDYDAFVREMSEELIGKAKKELSTAVGGNEKLVESTIKSTVTEKVFAQEIDQEATQLQGKLTITLSGIAYSEADVRALLTTVSSDKIPSGYSIQEAKATITIGDVQVKKDGKMVGKASMSAVALPLLDVAAIQKALAGKSLKKTGEYLRTLHGVGGVEVNFRLSPTGSYMPLRKENISVRISILQ